MKEYRIIILALMLLIAWAFTPLPAQSSPACVSATKNPYHAVELQWRAPSYDSSAILEDFESYADFSTEFGDWTLIDIDMGETYGLSYFDFPQEAMPMAYMIFNPQSTVPPLTTIAAHSGSKFAASFSSQIPPNNDWMISDVIHGGGEFHFWARSFTSQYGLERFRVGVSTQGSIPQAFNIISGANPLLAPTQWTEYMFDLSAYEGTRIQVGIQCVSNNALCFMVDDVYTLSYTATQRYLQGYKAWRLQVGDEANEANWTALPFDTIQGLSTYDVALPDQPYGTYKWAIKAKYSDGTFSAAAFSNPIYYGTLGTFRGSVKDFNTGRGIADAVIQAGIYSSATDEDGYYRMQLPLGTYTITASHDGYTSYTVENVATDQTQDVFLNFLLFSDWKPVKELFARVDEQDVQLRWFPPALAQSDQPAIRSGDPDTRDELISLTGFRIYRNQDLICQIDDPAATSYTDLNLSLGNYTYAVSALYDTGESTQENVVVNVKDYIVPLIIDEGFEAYPDFSLEFGDWTLLDQDGAATVEIPGIQFPNSGSEMAFMVFNPSQTTPPMQELYPFHGEKIAAAFCPQNSVAFDYIITPLIQLRDRSCIRFSIMSYAPPLNYGIFTLGVCTFLEMGPNPLFFDDLPGADSVLIPRNWTTFEYDLSNYDNMEVYIGLRCLAQNITAIFIDDIQVYSGLSPAVSLSHESYDFGTQYIDTDTDQEISISNTGGNGLIISQIHLSGDAPFSLIDLGELPFALAAGESESFTIRYSPTQCGEHQATVYIADNINAASHQIEYSGNCAAFEIDPLSYDFGNQEPGSSTEHEFTIRNLSAAGLVISQLELSGNESFSLLEAPDLPLALDIGDSESFIVRYAPEQSGEHHASISIVDNISNSPNIIELSGYSFVSNQELLNPKAVSKIIGNYPNPFNPQTNIRYFLKDSGHIRLEIINLKGQTVRILENTAKAGGEHTVIWDGKDHNGKSLSSGLYFYRLSSGSFSDTRKMLLMK